MDNFNILKSWREEENQGVEKEIPKDLMLRPNGLAHCQSKKGFFFLHPTILNIPKLILTYNLKRGTMLDFLCHYSSSSLNINPWWRVL